HPQTPLTVEHVVLDELAATIPPLRSFERQTLAANRVENPDLLENSQRVVSQVDAGTDFTNGISAFVNPHLPARAGQQNREPESADAAAGDLRCPVCLHERSFPVFLALP